MNYGSEYFENNRIGVFRFYLLLNFVTIIQFFFFLLYKLTFYVRIMDLFNHNLILREKNKIKKRPFKIFVYASLNI